MHVRQRVAVAFVSSASELGSHASAPVIEVANKFIGRSHDLAKRWQKLAGPEAKQALVKKRAQLLSWDSLLVTTDTVVIAALAIARQLWGGTLEADDTCAVGLLRATAVVLTVYMQQRAEMTQGATLKTDGVTKPELGWNLVWVDSDRAGGVSAERDGRTHRLKGAYIRTMPPVRGGGKSVHTTAVEKQMETQSHHGKRGLVGERCAASSAVDGALLGADVMETSPVHSMVVTEVLRTFEVFGRPLLQSRLGTQCDRSLLFPVPLGATRGQQNVGLVVRCHGGGAVLLGVARQ